MGFGILFIGYFITYLGALSGAVALPIAPFTYLVGAGIIIYSLKNLIYQNKLFLISMISAIALELVSIPVLVLNFTSPESSPYKVLAIIQISLAFITHLLLLFAILKISSELKITKIQSRAIVNLVVSTLALIFLILSIMLNEPLNQRFFLVGISACIIFVLFTLGAIFRCYASICYEGDEDMQRETGFAPFDFLNRMLNKAMNKNKDGKGKKK